MGFFKKAFKPFRKAAKKFIPKEIRPFLPYAAAMVPGLQGFAAAGGITNIAAQKALIAGLTAAATDEDANILRTAALAGGPDLLQQGLRGAGAALTSDKASMLKSLEGAKIGSSRLPISQEIGSMLTKAADSNIINLAANPTRREGLGGVMDVAKVVGGQTAVDQSAKFAEIRQE